MKAQPSNNVWNEKYYNESTRPGDTRKPYEHDPDRVVYSSAFRRLQAKTQVLGVGEGDFHRTRLTHSIEVSQLGLGILRVILRNNRINQDLKSHLPSHWNMTAICLAHDLGHPPYGHGGEVALNCKMIKNGGFEGNAQTFRIITNLEKYNGNPGLNLTRRTLLGLLKYPATFSRTHRVMTLRDNRTKLMRKLSKYESWDLFKPPKCHYDSESNVVEWILAPFSSHDRTLFTKVDKPESGKVTKPTGRSLDSSIMELADDIAYGVHDLEDMASLGLVDREKISINYESSWATSHGLPLDANQLATQILKKGTERWKRREAASAIINALVTSIEINEIPGFDHPYLRFTASLSNPARLFLDSLQDIVMDNVIESTEVRIADFKGMHLISNLFEAILSNTSRILKESFQEDFNLDTNDTARLRVVCDFIAGMTDEYAARYFERLFMPHQGSVFQKL